MSAPVDVLAVIRRHAESHRALAEADAYSAQEAPRLEATLAAVAELIEDMRRIKTAAALGIRYHATGPGYTEEIAQIADAALARVQPGTGSQTP